MEKRGGGEEEKALKRIKRSEKREKKIMEDKSIGNDDLFMHSSNI